MSNKAKKPKLMRRFDLRRGPKRVLESMTTWEFLMLLEHEPIRANICQECPKGKEAKR